MSEKNLQIIRKVYEFYNTGQAGATFEFFAPELSIHQTELLPWGGDYKGLSGLKEFLEKLVSRLNSKVEMRELISAGETVVAVGRTSGTVKKTGKSFDVTAVHLWTLKNEKIVKYQAYIDTPAMLAVLAED